MAIRVLGYKTVVEAKGTWPTNYIAKASELKVLEDVAYGKYTDGATRGNVALLMWNMLTTNMWDVTSENENNGLSYGIGEGVTMIDKYFADYTYTTVKFVDFAISEGKVVVELDDTTSEVELDKADGKYEYDEADFFTFVPGTEVEVLVNEKSEKLLLVIPTGENKLVEGTIDNLTDPDGNNYSFSGDTTGKEYAYGILGRNKVIEAGARLLDIKSSEYVYEIEEKTNKWVKINGTRFNYANLADEETIFVVDGTLGSFEDVKEGDILTKVSCHANEDFYIVGGSKVSGKLEAYSKNAGKIEIAGKKYDILAGATYVVDTEDEDASQTEVLANSIYLSDMKNEVVDAYSDFFGSIVRVEFDGELGDEEDEDVRFGFYAIKSWVEKSSARKYDVELENEAGKDTYVFADDSRSVATTLMTTQESTDIRNTIYYVLFNSDNEIVNMKPIANVVSGDLSGDESGEQTVVFTISGDKYNADKAKFSGDTTDKVVKVSNSTYVVTIEIDKKDNKNVDVTFDKDIELLDNLDVDDLVTVIYEKDSETITPTAKYVIINDKVNAKSSDLYGKLVDKYLDDVYGKTLVVETEEGEEIVYNNVADVAYNNVTSGEIIIRYEIETDEDDGKVTVTAASEIVNANTYPYAAKVALVNGSEVKLTLPDGSELIVDMNDEDTLEKYEDYRIIEVTYDYDDLAGTYEITSFEEKELKEVEFVKDDLFFDYTYITADDELMIILSEN